MNSFLVRRWFLILLVLVLVAGFSWPQLLQQLTTHIPENLVVATVLFLTALPLDAHAMWQALRRPTAAVLAFAINLGLLPLVAWGMSRGLRPELATGLLITASIPCTLVSATVWTRRAGGHEAVAILVTILTNLACFLVTPFWLWLTTGHDVPGGAIDPRAMAAKLALIVVVPILLAQGVRQWRAWGDRATRHKIPLGVISQFGILIMVLSSAVQAALHLAAESGDRRPTPFDWAAMVLGTVVLHVSMLAAGHALGRLFNLPLPDRIAVGFAGSQKTLMVGITVSASFAGAALAILPMVVYHIGQLLIDTVVADWFRAQGDRFLPPESPAEEAADDL